MVKISIIVPVYNKENYIKDCLDSLINQTLKEIEIICVDDKSTDHSLEIVEERKQVDKRIKLIKSPLNLGSSAARNLGLKEAKGEFIGFVDADDFVEPDFFEKLYKESNEYDCIKGEVWDYNSLTKKSSLNRASNLNKTIKDCNNPLYFYYGFTSAIYRKEFLDINNISFPKEITYNEDPYFSLMVATKLKNIKVVDNAKYFYREVLDSQCRVLTKEKGNIFYKGMTMMINYLNNLSSMTYEDKYILAYQMLNQTFYTFEKGCLDEEEYKLLTNGFKALLKNDREVNEPKISIIIPIYNAEKYLRNTLAHLMFQSLYDIEIICVDDKSTDHSLEIVEELKQVDKRIKLIKSPLNLGASTTRNMGIKEAKGEYIGFVDADDYVDLDFFKTLYENANNNDADVSKGNEIDVTLEGEFKAKTPAAINRNKLYFNTGWWTAIYRRTFLLENNILLDPDCIIGEDLKFLFDATSKCNKVVGVNDVNYYYVKHQNSLDSSNLSVNKINSVICVFNYILDKLNKLKVYEEDITVYLNYYLLYIRHILERIQECHEETVRLLCSDFLFDAFEKCKAKEILLESLLKINLTLAFSLAKDQKDFFDKLISEDALANIYYYSPTNESDGKIINYEPFKLITTDKNKNNINKYWKENPFINNNLDSFEILKTSGRTLPEIFNSFIDVYDFAEESWLIFAKNGFELLCSPILITEKLDRNVIYGVMGGKAIESNGKFANIRKGHEFEKDEYNSLIFNEPDSFDDIDVDTIDSRCIIIHSSLIEKYNLSFDEQFVSDYFVEDLCLRVKKENNVETKVINIDCVYHLDNESNENDLELLQSKHREMSFGGSKFLFNSKDVQTMSSNEIMLYLLREKIRKQ